jgi:hypothetical protein
MRLNHALDTGLLAVPEDGPVSWTAHADLAEAAVVVLTEGGFEGPPPHSPAPWPSTWLT